jgi:serine/threonine protein kinase
MSGREETHGAPARNLAETSRGTDARSPEQRDLGETVVEMQASARPRSPKEPASYQEFADALVEIGLIDAAELRQFAADSAEGVLGLSRALVKAGKLTSYQAAAVYQNKSRGLLIGNYLILDKLGQGGMGMVFKARHRTLGRLGALKILPPSFTRDRGAVMRFRREFEAAGRLRHLNLVAAFEADEDRGVNFLVMDYVQGINLDRVVAEHGPLPLAEAVDYLIQSARGLEAAHENGIVHRDIKPANLMLDRHGTVRVLDLGLARIVDPGNAFNSSVAGRLTQTGVYMGTIDYMAPEQAEDSHNVDHRADIYSLGCTFYFLLSGREPFPGPTILRRMVAHQEHPAPSLRAIRPDVSPALEAAYQKMMSKKPEDRPASMSEVIALLHASRPSSGDAGSIAPPAQPSLGQAVTDQRPLERGSPPRTMVDSAIFARRSVDADMLGDRELNLRDLVMDVRSDVYAPDEACADRNESQGACDDHELNLRELAREFGEDAGRARAPRPTGSDPQMPKGKAAPQQDETPSRAPIPCAAAQPLKPAPAARQEARPPAAPKPPAAQAPPPKHTAGARQQAALPPASNPPLAERQPLKRTMVSRQEDAPPAAPLPPAAKRRPLSRPEATHPDNSTTNKGVALLAVVTVVLVAMAIVVSIARRPPAVAKKDESSKPALDPAESEGSSYVPPASPTQGEP